MSTSHVFPASVIISDIQGFFFKMLENKQIMMFTTADHFFFSGNIDNNNILALPRYEKRHLESVGVNWSWTYNFLSLPLATVINRDLRVSIACYWTCMSGFYGSAVRKWGGKKLIIQFSSLLKITKVVFTVVCFTAIIKVIIVLDGVYYWLKSG